MIHEELTFTVKKAFGNLYRKVCVLIAVEDGQGNILVGAKPYMFPPTITRLLGGGVHDGEDPKAAAVRELAEELGVQVSEDDLKELAVFATKAADEDGREFHNDSYIYYANIGAQKYTAGDDVTHVVALTLDELTDLGEQYLTLPEALWYNGPEGTYSWADYAKLYGPIHKGVAKMISDLTK